MLKIDGGVQGDRGHPVSINIKVFKNISVIFKWLYAELPGKYRISHMEETPEKAMKRIRITTSYKSYAWKKLGLFIYSVSQLTMRL